MFDIITVGSATVDVFIHTAPTQTELLHIHHHKDICYPLGSKVLIKELNIFTGGGGTNTAVAFSRLGLKTGFVGKVGNDENGKIILESLPKERVEFLGEKEGISGYSVILDAVESDRTIFTYKGCNDSLKFKEIKTLDARWFYFSSMLKVSLKTQIKLSEYAKKHSIKIAYNPSLYLAREGKWQLKKILKNTEIIIFNKEEAQALVHDVTNNIFNLLFEVSKLGPKIIVITDAHNGAHCYNTYDEYVYSAKPGRVKVVETTGAGDAFASGFVTAIILGKDISHAIKLGMLNAESVIAHLGAKNILLDTKAFRMAEHDHRAILKKRL